MWDATINFNGTEIPFKMGISGDGANIKGWFFNGDDKEISNSGKLENGALELDFDSYLAKLTATVKNGVIEGEYGPILKKMYRVEATRATGSPAVERRLRAFRRRPMGSDGRREFQRRERPGE